MELRLPAPSLIVLVGPSGCGKSTWAEENFARDQIVSSDRLRGVVGTSEHDQKASKDAFELLHRIVDARLKRKLTTVIDTLGLNDDTRLGYLELARKRKVTAHIVRFETPPSVCRERNKRRARPVPARVLSGQIKQWEALADSLVDEGFDGVHVPGEVMLVPPDQLDAPDHARRQHEVPVALEFGLYIPSFSWPGGAAETADKLAEVAVTAEEAGFSSLWVMDHFRQIHMLGPEWHDMLDSYTTLGHLAAHTKTVRLGALVSGIMYRNPAHLGKIVATLDVLSGGRAICGLGIGWFEKEHVAYGWDFPDLFTRYAMLEDTLQLLPLLWGPGTPAFEGRVVSVPEAMCYPRPLQEKVPILVGGSGEKKTLRLVARYADACNLVGDPGTVKRKVSVLRDHCDSEGRDFNEIEVTHLGQVLIGTSRADVDAKLEGLRPANTAHEQFASTVNAGTVDEQVGRYRILADAGVQCAIVNFPDLNRTDLEASDPVRTFARVIEAFKA